MPTWGVNLGYISEGGGTRKKRISQSLYRVSIKYLWPLKITGLPLIMNYIMFPVLGKGMQLRREALGLVALQDQKFMIGFLFCWVWCRMDPKFEVHRFRGELDGNLSATPVNTHLHERSRCSLEQPLSMERSSVSFCIWFWGCWRTPLAKTQTMTNWRGQRMKIRLLQRVVGRTIYKILNTKIWNDSIFNAWSVHERIFRWTTISFSIAQRCSLRNYTDMAWTRDRRK